MSESLKPCPVCGGKSNLIFGAGEYCVFCDECGWSGLTSSNEFEVIEDWNHRDEKFLGGLETCRCRRLFISYGAAFTEIWDMGTCIADVVFEFISADKSRCPDLECVTDQNGGPMCSAGGSPISFGKFCHLLRDKTCFPMGKALFDNGLGEVVTHWDYKGGK